MLTFRWPSDGEYLHYLRVHSLDTSSDPVNFTIDGASVTGPFEGSNSGASDAISGSTGVDSGSGLLASSASKKGLKRLWAAAPPISADPLGLEPSGDRVEDVVALTWNSASPWTRMRW